ncbi:hypothetical protein [Pseudomonas gingeri]|uniref:hypothetical protein n=1 Tax=Pseudomonas gingeri TaxID=117681 RepID=UPI0015A0E1AE|nr:hypothetical protein [Pseudomonas gingeri]NWA02746.1 hypothetical protein [Pseudomonas gingeri]NWA12080.1 hypothetical protein [Pseudomonas gingeri]NWA57513.1 hypothetical protein [Pseudomonas gingeri]NWA93856.1 hypothetical protein [Pseudomonas gingeri]NWB03328.1 hypothetical protein [Pseudomonas gingeri]
MTLTIPDQPIENLRAGHIIAEGLLNPRGLCARFDGSLLLVEAGSGLPDQPFSGRISRLLPDPRHPSAYLPAQILAQGYRSMNMQARMLRDEIMGLSDIAHGEGRYLVSLTDYVEGSRLLDLQYSPPEPVFSSRGNLNALCYHPTRRSWLAVKPDANQLVEFTAEHGEQVLVELPDLDQGQDAVPVTLVHEPATDAVLISLFSGELHSTPAQQGIDFAGKAGQVIRAWPANGQIETVVRGLQLPTGLALTSTGQLLVLELCDRLLEPLPPGWAGETRHGGFERFSGRLLSCDLRTGQVSVLARGLDTPSNLCLVPGAVVVSEGMGLTGRTLPTPQNGMAPLTGRLRRIPLDDQTDD